MMDKQVGLLECLQKVELRSGDVVFMSGADSEYVTVAPIVRKPSRPKRRVAGCDSAAISVPDP